MMSFSRPWNASTLLTSTCVRACAWAGARSMAKGRPLGCPPRPSRRVCVGALPPVRGAGAHRPPSVRGRDQTDSRCATAPAAQWLPGLRPVSSQLGQARRTEGTQRAAAPRAAQGRAGAHLGVLRRAQRPRARQRGQHMRALALIGRDHADLLRRHAAAQQVRDHLLHAGGLCARARQRLALPTLRVGAAPGSSRARAWLLPRPRPAHPAARTAA